LQEITERHSSLTRIPICGTNKGMAIPLEKRNSRLRTLLSWTVAGAFVGALWARLHHGAGTSIHSWHDFVLSREHAGFPPGILISIVLLVLFSLYWEVAAKDAADTKTQESRASRGIHLTLVTAAQLLLLLPIPGLRARFLPNTTALTLIGLVIEAAFLLLAVWARQLLGRNWSGAVAIKVDQALIRSGPYNFVRHPIYSAMLGAYLGIAIISGEIHALLGLILACFAYWRKIRIEEQYLSTVFGSAYVDYQAHVSALIPGVL
jgi:protein-S-isoprenylcysteine O-methyltransferase Ste14